MESIYPQNETPDLETLTQTLADVFPQIGEIAPLKLFGAGFGAAVVETAGGVVVRIARNAYAQASLARQAQLLPAVRQQLPVAIPEPRWQAEPSPAAPFGAIAYPRLPGSPLTPGRLAADNAPTLAHDLAAFLFALHHFPVDEAITLGALPVEERKLVAAEQSGAAVAILRAGLTPDEFATVERWYAATRADAPLSAFTPALLHGDLWYENILVDDEAAHITGVVDFENMGIGDPAEDLATLLYLGDEFQRLVVAEYLIMNEPDALGDNLDQRVRVRWEMREFLGVGFAALYDLAELPDALEKLRRGPIFREAGG
ncbi:MAG TPA: phosphotransferase [Ktedonobacterales bacterium]|nr:phosphotransferase [Ktedonobacterales bacterium]